MKNKYLKVLLDVVMTVLMVLLMNTFITGMLIHEILGIFICLLIIIHNFLNYKWIKAVTLNLFNGSVHAKTKVMYVLDLLLLFGITLILLSGVLISKNIFSFALPTEQLTFWSTLHHSASYGSLVLISVHIGMHWASIMSAFKKMIGITGTNKARTILARATAVCIMLLGIKCSADKDVIGNIAFPFTANNKSGVRGETIRGYKESEVQTQLTTTNVSTQDTTSQTLEDYLSGLICTGCHKRCPLSSPQCGRGEQQASEAETAFYNENSASASSQAESDSDQTNPVSNQTSGAGSNSIASLLEFIPIMGLFAGGTHYTVVISEKLKNSKHA